MMMQLWRGLTVACLTMVLVSTGLAADDDAKALIRALQEQWIEAVHAGDVDTIVGFYAEDAHFLPAGSAALRGSNEIRQWWEKTLAEENLSTLTFGPTHIELAAGGELAYEVGQSRQQVTAEGETRTVKGKYLVVWRRIDGEWQVVADMFNSNQALAKERRPHVGPSPFVALARLLPSSITSLPPSGGLWR